MSSPMDMDEGFDVSGAREVAVEYAGDYAAPARPAQETAGAKAERPSVTISLSPEAKAALESNQTESGADRTKREAIRGAKEIAAASGVSEAQAVQAAQPTRSPPPAKGAALFQANLTAEKPKG